MINYRQLTKDDDNFLKNLISYEGKHYDDFLSLGWSKNQIINQINKKTNLAFGAFYSSKTKKTNLIPGCWLFYARDTKINFILKELIN